MQYYSKVAGLQISCNFTEYRFIFNNLSRILLLKLQVIFLGPGAANFIEISEWLPKYENDCKTFLQQQCGGVFRKSY